MFSGSEIHIYLYAADGSGESDITADCIFSQCRFEVAMNAQPGLFEVAVKDSDQTRSFRTGQRIKLVIDGVTLFGGFVRQVGNKFAFPVDDTSDIEAVDSRLFVLRGVDYNILLDTRVLRNTADYLHQIPDLPGDTPDGVAIRTMCSRWLDLPAGFSVAKVENVGFLWFEDGPEDAQGFPLPYPDPSKTWPWMTQGTKMRDMIESIAEPNRAIYWIDGEMRLWYVAIDDSTMPWGFSDVPNNNPIANGTDGYGTGANRPASTIGFRDLDLIEDGSVIVTDGMVWGGKALTSGNIVFARVQNKADGTTTKTSQEYVQQGDPVAGSPLDVYGRWQRGEIHVGEDYYGTLGNVKIRARNIVAGPTGSVAGQERGLSRPQFTIGLTWYAHEVPQTGGRAFHVRPGYFTNIELYTFGENREASGQTVRVPLVKTLPARSIEISFPTLDSRDGSSYVEFNGTFGLSADDPWSLWKYLSQRGVTPTPTPIPVDNGSTSAPTGGAGQFTASPLPDGSQTDFSLPYGYVAGSLQVWVNGIQQTKGTNFVELNNVAGTFRVTLAPPAGATVTAATTTIAGTITVPPAPVTTTGAPGTVTVTEGTVTGQSAFRVGAYAVQRFLRSLSSGERTAALALMKDAVDLITYHWSGGYHNATTSSQQWSTSDFADTTDINGTRTYGNVNGFRSLDQAFADLDDLIALRPAAKITLVMHDFPVAMNPGFTRTDRHNPPWPAATYWAGTYAGRLCSEIIARYPGKILAFSYGQELKGISNRTSTTELDAFAAGFTAWATYMEANHPAIERWYPHLNYWSTASLTARQAAIDALLAGGSQLQAADETIINRLMDQVDPSLVDRMTYDCSILDNNSDTWRGNFSAVSSRASLEYHLQRVLKAKMTSRWGSQKPLVAIESYFDVNQTAQDWASEAQSAVLQTAIAIWAMKGGVSYHNRWEPQGGTPGQEAPDGDIASWWTNHAVAFAAWAQIRDLRITFPPGTDLYAVGTGDTDIVAVAGGSSVYILNLSSASRTITINGAFGTRSVNISGYSYTIAPLTPG